VGFIVPPGHRAYVAAHPLGVCLSLGIAASGWIRILWPGTAADSPSSLVLPAFILFTFNVAWAAGGTLAAVGLLRGKAKMEGVGMSLLASALAAYYCLILSLRPLAALTAVFIVFLAVGCALRAYHVATHAYINLDVPHDHIPEE
jgi:hypothetical protein